MANKAADLRAKAQTIWDGATVNARGRSYIVHQHPTESARKMIDNSIGKIHYGANEDQEIDTAWQATTGAWDYEMTLNDFQVYARDTFNVGNLFRFEIEGGDYWVQFDPQSINWIDENTSRQQIAIKQAVSATVNDDRLIFSGGYGTGIDFEYVNQTARIRKIITIDQASRLPEVTLQGNDIYFEAEFSLSVSSNLDIYLDDQLWTRQNGQRVQTADYIEFRDDTTGEVKWWLDFARAWDSASSETIGQMEVRRQGGPSSLFVTVRVPKSWIDTASFPIYIDPTIDELVGASADDAYESSSTVVTITGGSIGNVDSADEYIGLRFDAITISSGSTIDSASLDFYISIGSLDEPEVDIYGLDTSSPAAFAESNGDISGRTVTTASVAWSETNLGAPGGPYSSSDIASVVQELVDSYEPYSSGVMGFRINSTNGNAARDFNPTGYDGSTSECPNLHIEYTESGGSTVIQDMINGGIIPFAR